MLAILLASALAVAGPDRVSFDGCDDVDETQVRRIVALELRGRSEPQGRPVRVLCARGEATIEVVDDGANPVRRRVVSLTKTSPEARARELALAIAETVEWPAAPAPPPEAPVVVASPKPELAEPARASLRASAAAVFDHGTLAGWTPGVEVRAGVARAWWAFDASGSVYPERSIALPSETAAGGRFTLVSAALHACVVRGLGDRRASVKVCGVGDVDRVGAAGYGVNQPRSVVRTAWALGGELGAAARVWRAAWLVATAAWLVPGLRQTYAFDDLGPILRADSRLVRLALGLELRVP